MVLLHGDPLDYLEFRAFACRDFIDSADLRAVISQRADSGLIVETYGQIWP